MPLGEWGHSPLFAQRKRGSAPKLASGLFALAFAGAGAADPLPTREQNPVLAGFGLPAALPSARAQSGEWSMGLDLSWGSTALIQADADEALIIDAETREARLTLVRGLSERLSLQLQAPYRYTGPGTLDGFIDSWHDFFRLPEGARPVLPRDQLRLTYVRNGAAVLDTRASQQGLGDVSIALGYHPIDSAAASFATWLSIELPTGDAAKLTGNDAYDVSLIAAGQRRFARWSVFAQAGVTRVGAGGVLADWRRELVWSGLAGVSWRMFPALELTLQADARSAAVDGGAIDFLGESAVLTLGGAVHFARSWRLDLGVSEDLAVETAPDVVFVLGLSRDLHAAQ
jgi:Protein of unknown function (DUF3187)